ncbi:archaellin/type IV pilin N-terminal domain-containing protein [Halobacterium jilantaiense]|uniref:Flagellin n=1 Tax=Halobacterium jilantaiense TaxID=355548 RepID=A0A1I0MYI6_9EURY|nr:archaellin/type IV pilin N-terminal domain-containing protein [Halobacterium jilantaiense]SEV93719.1 flagellin FlaA [Halobacterium jilantaiense]
MFEFINDEDERGQVGIGTLIVFIAMVLVAAIAAGVLINTAGFLQSKGAATGEEASAQVSNRINVVSAYGNVNSTDGETVDYVNLTVRQAAGADNINLSKSTIQWIGPDTATTLVYDSGAANAENFTTEQIKGNNNPVLVDQSDRLKVVMDSASITTDGLKAGEEVQLTLTTQYGSKTSYWANVPESLKDKNAVNL